MLELQSLEYNPGDNANVFPPSSGLYSKKFYSRRFAVKFGLPNLVADPCSGIGFLMCFYLLEGKIKRHSLRPQEITNFSIKTIRAELLS